MWILIRWLRQKPVDLDLQCFQKRINLGSVGQWLNALDLLANSVDLDHIMANNRIVVI